MTPALSPASRPADSWPTRAAGLGALLAGQVILLVLANLWEPDAAGDVRGVYHDWMTHAALDGAWPVLDFDWVYPVLALIPLWVAYAFEALFGSYVLSWCLLVVLLNSAAAAVVWRQFGFRRGNRAIYLWQVAAVLAGPLPMARLDGVLVPFLIAALALATSRPKVAAVLLTVGAWIKVTPGAAFLALFAAGRDRLKKIVGPALAASLLVVVGAGVAGASVSRVLSFLTIQSGRHLQVEAVAGTGLIFYHKVVGGDWMTYNYDTLTLEFTSSAAGVIAQVCGIVLPLVAAAIAWLAYRASQRADRHDVILVAAAAELSAMIVFNQVGSPQFVSWVFPAAAIGVAAFRQSRWWRWQAALALVAAALTHPVNERYLPFLALDWDMLIVFALRNAAYIAIFVLATSRLGRLARQGGLFWLYDLPKVPDDLRAAPDDALRQSADTPPALPAD